ncbi:MAG: hypothetical protein EA403_09995 [Spirochaetaceae bacterium]|nr:MAG: hypothetical protein EA403_09995 [Spirochaetaceae bacterium]
MRKRLRNRHDGFIHVVLTIAATVLLLGGPVVVAYAQERVDAPWMRYEQGVIAFGEGRLGEALRHFRAAATARSPFPEADFWIGRVFQAEGSLDLALRHYEQALLESAHLDPPETQVLIRYQIAEVRRLRGEVGEFERILSEIAREEEEPRDVAITGRPQAHLRVLQNQGIDRLMVLYRLQEGFSHQARRELGVHLADTNRYDEGLPHLLTAAMKGLSTLVDDLRRSQYDYRWTELGTVIADAWDYAHLRDYIERVELFRTLYYLGLALETEHPDSDSAEAIWRALSVLPVADQWHLLALQRVPGPTFRRR